MDLRHLQTLVVLAEELHYGRAARRLHVVQSAVTRTIQDLEEEVGARLFRRDRRSVELTAAGQALVVRAREILAATRRATEECRAVGEGTLGRLRIAVAALSGSGRLPEALRAFHAKSPSVAIELSEISAADQVTAIVDGRVDVAFTHTPIEAAAIVVEAIASEPLCAILPADHELARLPAVPASRMLTELVAIPPRSSAPGVHRALAAHAGSHGLPAPRVMEVENINVMMTLVAAGLLISHLPESIARIGFRGVVAIPVEPAYRVELFAVYREGDGSPPVRALLAEMRSARAR